MASTIACLPPANPAFLRVYHLTSSQFALNDLALGRLKVARFSDLNDPFELIAANFRERPIRKVIRDFKRAFSAHTGALCFSANWAEPLLWSHYADKHRGMCFGFDVPRALLQEVGYEHERIFAQLGHEENPMGLSPTLKRLLLCTKYRGWSYEQEHRRFVRLRSAKREGPLHFMSFGRNLNLTEVIVGPECRVSLRDVWDLVRQRHPNALCYKARLAIGHFSVVPDEWVKWT